jgi:hypothetical protein
MSIARYKYIYTELLPIFVPITTLMGFAFAITDTNTMNHPDPIGRYINLVGHTTIGFTFGLLYPITFPASALFVIYQKNKR